MVAQNVTVLICVYNSINFNKILCTTGCNAAPNRDRFSNMFYRCHSHSYLSPYLLLESKLSNLDSSLLLPLFLLACVIWHPSAFSPLSLMDGILTVTPPLRPFSDKPSVKGTMHLSSPMSGLCWIFFPVS